MQTRRETILGSVTAAAVALAGCVESIPGGGESDEPAAADWIAESVFDSCAVSRCDHAVVRSIPE